MAGSDESAIRYEHLQTELGEGPCLAAFETDEPICIPNLREEDRFPRFTERALEEGLVAAFTFPRRNGDRCLGALDLYRRTAGTLDADDMTTAQTLADVATAYLLNAEARMAKNDFVENVSHELRTPMTSIAGYVELLRSGDEGPMTPGQDRFVEAIGRSSQRLTALANDLLALSSLESPGREHPHSKLNLGDIIRGAQEALEPVITASQLSVTFTIPPDPVTVQGSRADLEALVMNLLTNALKFTEAGGWVTCELSALGRTACIEVSDNGLGIPLTEQHDLFTRFFRSTTAQEHAIQGTGLGLSIVDSIIRNHGGDISVDSEHLKGTTFTVNLPLIAQPSGSLSGVAR